MSHVLEIMYNLIYLTILDIIVLVCSEKCLLYYGNTAC